MLAGGPGRAEISSGFFRLFQPEMPGRILETRGTTIVEQRGTQYTNPWLLCPDLDAAPWTAYEQGLTSEEANAFGAYATLVVFPGRTHEQIAGVNLCAAAVMTQFVLDPTTSLDTSCTETSPPLGFALPDGTMSTDE